MACKHHAEEKKSCDLSKNDNRDRSEDADPHGPFVGLRHGVVDRSNETPRRDAVAYLQTGTVRLHWSSRAEPYGRMPMVNIAG